MTPEWIRERLSNERGAQAELARSIGLTPVKMSLVMGGKRRLTAIETQKVLQFFGEESPPPTVPVVAYVGAGSEVYPVDDHEKGDGIDEVVAPPGAGPSAVAVIVRGDSMFPKYEDGDVLIYDERRQPDELIGKICVVEIEDGRVLVKHIKRGAGDLFTLTSINAPDIDDVKIVWAARVGFVIPAP